MVLQEFSNLRLMMTRMSNRVSQKTGFDPSLGKDAQVRQSRLLTTNIMMFVTPRFSDEPPFQKDFWISFAQTWVQRGVSTHLVMFAVISISL